MTQGNTEIKDVEVVQKGQVVNIDPQALIAQGIDKGVSIEVMERLLDMRDRLRREESEMAFREAMSLFQSECPIIPKTKGVLNKDGSVRYKYAPLDDIVKIVQPYIAKHGLSYKIETETISEPPQIKVAVRVYHTLGHSEETSFQIPVDKNSYMNAPQQWASCSTFAKRYTFCNAFGILTGDEDTDTAEISAEEEKKNTDHSKAMGDKKREAMEKMKALPPDIKSGFEILGYKANTIWQFCEDRTWDYEKIKTDINKAVDKRA